MSLAIKCKGCGREIPAGDVNIDTRLAKCLQCNAVFEISTQVADQSRGPRASVPMPKNMEVAEGPGSLTVVRKWKAGSLGFFFVVFALIWNLIVSVFVAAMFFGDGATWEGSDRKVSPAFMWLFLTPFILIGLGTGYASLAFLFNRTRVSIEGDQVEVIHRPFRWFGNRRLDAREINQLFCTEYVAYKSNDQPQFRMCVNAILQDGARLELIKGLEDTGQAFYLEDLIERHLRIPDRPVSGEYRRAN